MELFKYIKTYGSNLQKVNIFFYIYLRKKLINWVDNMSRVNISFITDKQMEILAMRAQGQTQEEIASKLGTTRENITITEKRAKENIRRARATILAYEMLDPVECMIPPGTDIFDMPGIIFHQADRNSIKVHQNATSLIGLCRREAGRRIMGNKITEDLEVRILRSGQVIF